MAPTVDFTQFRAEDGSNTKRRNLGIYTGPASYVAGGDPFTPGDVKLGAIHLLLFEAASNGAVILFLLYDYTNEKVKAFDMAGVEVTGATDLSAYTARFEAIGY